MDLRIVEDTPAGLAEYEKISIAFEVKTRFRVELLNDGLNGVKLTEETLDAPFIKDYDAIETERPSRWNERFELENWGILSAFDGAKRIGGAAIAWKTPEVSMLDGSADLACLWDLRVAPEFRGQGVGKMLFEKAVNWAIERNCRLFKVETQNINVPACRFYAARGCHLGGFNLYAYPAEMNEIQMLWYRKI
jgi:GNAT superfamily N-acetyltransferase